MTAPSRPQRGMFAGSGIAIGAAIGMLFGLLLSADLVLMVGLGVAVGLVVGAIIDLQRRADGSGLPGLGPPPRNMSASLAPAAAPVPLVGRAERAGREGSAPPRCPCTSRTRVDGQKIGVMAPMRFRPLSGASRREAGVPWRRSAQMDLSRDSETSS